MDVTPEERTALVSMVSDRLLDVTTGHTRQEAEEVAAAMVDRAIAHSDQNRAGYPS